MRYLKPRFWYHKGQRVAVLSLLLIIVVLQLMITFFDGSSDSIVATNTTEIQAFNSEIDSLKKLEIQRQKPKIFPFNPNYITDYKGYKLGMPIVAIDRLFAFRKQKKFVHSAAEFQKVTKISDSLLRKIAPYFKFPNWRIKKSQQKKSFSVSNRKIEIAVIDLNIATAAQLQTVFGIGKKLSARIVKYRRRLQGFSLENQLYEVWGLDTLVVDRVLSRFKVLSKPKIKKININTASFKTILKNPYIDYELCKKIVAYREEVAELQSLSELKNIEGFPIKKYQRIILYLTAR